MRTLIVDELDEFAANLQGGDDPVEMLNGRTSAFPPPISASTSAPADPRPLAHRCLYEKSDQRATTFRALICGEEQPLEWSGLRWGPGGTAVAYVCRGAAP